MRRNWEILALFLAVLIRSILTDDNVIWTTGGTGDGKKCVFPFKYKGILHFSCIDKEFQQSDGPKSTTKFCATTYDLEKDNEWGYCLDYSACHFPFTYGGNRYTDCISTSEASRICATTDNFDRDRKWAHCPVICQGYPDKIGPVIEEKSFALSTYSGSNCKFDRYLSKLTGDVVRIYSIPPCKTTFECQGQNEYKVNVINCKSDGSFDRRATCANTNNTKILNHKRNRFFYRHHNVRN